MSDSDLVIRPYLPEDREELLRIGADTAFFGAPIEAYMEDRNAFLDAFYAYYTDLEPEHTWVASANGKVVGFLTGCVDTRKRDREFLRVILPHLAGNVLRGKYHFGKRSLQYFTGLIGGLIHGEFTRVDLNSFPAHLHIKRGGTLARQQARPTVNGGLPHPATRFGDRRCISGYHQS